MTKYLNFFESESGFTEAVEAGQLFYPNVSYTEEDDTVHWNLEQPADPVETPMLRMHFITSTPGQEVKLRNGSGHGVTAMEIDGTAVNYASGGTYTIAEPGNHTAVYQFASSKIPEGLFNSESGEFDTFTSAEIISAVTEIGYNAFNRCGGLTGVSMSDSVTYISTGAFDNCPLLQSVVLSDNLTSIWVGAFRQCPALTSIDIPDSVTTIAFQAFASTGLRSVTVPDSVTELSEQCFARCGDLRSAVIGSGVTTVGEKAFSGCGGLTEIYFNSVTPPTLGANALDNTNNCPIYVPAASVDTYKEAWPGYASRIKTKHRISASVNDEDKGEVMLDQETAPEGDTVGFSVSVFDSEQNQVSSVTVTDGNGDEVQVTDKGDNRYNFTMPGSDVSISVAIEADTRPKYNIMASVNDETLGEVSIQETASEGDTVNFHVNVFDTENCEVEFIIAHDGNGDEVQVTDEGNRVYSFTMPGSEVFVSAYIRNNLEGQHRISANVNDEELGQVDVLNGETASEGDWVGFNVNVFDSDANHVSSVTVTDGNGNNVQVNDEGDNHYNFTMPASDVTIFATLEEKPIGQYHISVDLNDGSQGEVSLFKETAQETANEGDTVRLQVNVFDPENYRVGLVSVTDGNGDKVQVTNEHYDNYYRFTMPASDVTIRVVMVTRVKQ